MGCSCKGKSHSNGSRQVIRTSEPNMNGNRNSANRRIIRRNMK